LLYFEHPITLSIIIISTARSSKSKDTYTPTIPALIIQEYTATVKVLDIFYRDRAKLDNFFIFMDIYIFFNQYLFGSESAKVIYIISYLRGITFNWVKTYIDDFINHKIIKRKVTIITRDITQNIFTNYNTFKENIRQVFRDIE
jgi:hypothetical protein